MRRRRSAQTDRSAEETVALWQRVQADADALKLEPADRSAYVRDVLRLHGTDPLEALRARYWLRRGRTGNGWRF